ncbi:MAG: sigma-54 interaction domain-containing protein [Bacteroidota bacterium]|jgi:transcriptional regulator with PAS, ATPase and Fis domain|nr:sigma 54-interacting transcriptional regulator [Cytophagales bacterium]MCE2957699.1 sigma 54-interacting transcriptional regulator [Flammeovirgaceae bacterium]MCZ8071752.1 sigma 54-interacting transcriptional regulator [Cytophagales bacterium]
MASKESEIQSIKQRFGIIGNAQLLNHAVEVAMQVAPTDMTVLITGESGSGKESFSKIIHQLSPRKHGQFIAINCGSIPEGTIDSELFGHEKGSFTGAHEARKGYFEVTNGGTIFLDEIGEMPLATQARLLRVLENGEFIKVGSSKVQKTDVRVVAATNVNLLNKVEQGKFREDLYYRLNTVPIFVPPLRERGTDVELLFRKFATDFSEKYKVKPITLTPDAKEILLKYRFPGNIRQLKNLVEQISVLSPDKKEINAGELAYYIPKESTLPAVYSQNAPENISEREILYKVLFDMKKDVNDLKKMVLEAMANPAQAAQLIKDNANLFESVRLEEKKPATEVVLNISPVQPAEHHQEAAEEVQDISHVAEDDSLSIEKKERELILRALRKNNNKRKYAARDLGISERTLYRKIKEYELEED